MRHWGGMLGAVALILCAGAASARDGWAALAQPGAIGLLRHATAPGTGDPATFQLGDCATQRNLSDAGRDEARAIGQAVRQRGIAIDHVLTSQWCRARETAELLGLGPVVEAPALNSFFEDRGSAARQSAATLDLMGRLPDAARAILVTHQVNITALTGLPVASGQMIVVARDAEGGLQVTGTISLPQ